MVEFIIRTLSVNQLLSLKSRFTIGQNVFTEKQIKYANVSKCCENGVIPLFSNSDSITTKSANNISALDTSRDIALIGEI